MTTKHDPSIPALLKRIRDGDADATAALLDLAYTELHGIARHVFSGQSQDHTLQPTALVHEVCARMLSSPGTEWTDREHFFRVAAKAMRNLLVDHARAKRSLKRGGGATRVSLEEAEEAAPAREVDLVALDDTIRRLEETDPRLSQIFELRYLVGLSVEQAAALLGVSARTVELDSRLIRAWLQRELYG
jgi:RNA polymerase sigma factor (TIGR02999 family)